MRMNDDTMRAGADPAEAAPDLAQTETLPAAAVKHTVSMALVQLEDNLISATRLLDLCTQMSCEPGEAGLSAMKIAAQLLRARHESAAALARVARGESRHRVIVELADTSEARLNSKISPPPPHEALNRPRKKAATP